MFPIVRYLRNQQLAIGICNWLVASAAHPCRHFRALSFSSPSWALLLLVECAGTHWKGEWMCTQPNDRRTHHTPKNQQHCCFTSLLRGLRPAELDWTLQLPVLSLIRPYCRPPNRDNVSSGPTKCQTQTSHRDSNQESVGQTNKFLIIFEQKTPKILYFLTFYHTKVLLYAWFNLI